MHQSLHTFFQQGSIACAMQSPAIFELVLRCGTHFSISAGPLYSSHTHTHTQLQNTHIHNENRENKNKARKAVKENSSGTAELS